MSGGTRFPQSESVEISLSLVRVDVFIITDKSKTNREDRKLVGEEVKGVGVMKDEELKLEQIEGRRIFHKDKGLVSKKNMDLCVYENLSPLYCRT